MNKSKWPLLLVVFLLASETAVGANTGVGTAYADILINTHYRCWDDTLRVSHGGWVSYRHMAEEHCEAAAQAYPHNVLSIQEEQY